jgi:histidine ammonia-lyase
MLSPLVLDGSALSITDVELVARADRKIEIGRGAIDRLTVSRRVVEGSLADGQAHYGINTGFGSLSRQRVADSELRELQLNLVRSHAAGVGAPLGRDVVRAMMVLLAASLCRGFSGVRPVVVERLLGMLNAGVTPVVPETGSVGASGDLAPLAHLALVLVGEGHASIGARGAARGELDGASALRSAGLEPLSLEAKEGLALINGTHLMAARAALLCADFDRLAGAAVVAAAMSIDACRGTDVFLDERVYRARNQPGPAAVAAQMRGLLAGSQIIPSHVEGDSRVQDPYSLRCTAPVVGAALDAAAYVRSAVEAELGAVTDNPLVFADEGAHGRIVSAGNFHGMPVALPLDVLAVALAHIAGISERRVFFLLAATEPESHLVPYLSPRPGLHSGLMIAQYTAAACCNEIAGLAFPASVVNIPTSAGIEDYNSFGPRAGAKAARALDLARHVIAVELICAAEGLERHRPLRSGQGVERAHEVVRAAVARYTADRPPGPDIERIAARIADGAFVMS